MEPCRRALTSVLLIGVVSLLGAAATRAAGKAGAVPVPETPKQPVVDTYHGVKVTDDYRWLEDWNDAKVKAWSDAQNAHARSVLDSLPSVAEIRARLTELETKASVGYFSLAHRGDLLFALKQQPPKQQPLLVVLNSLDDLTTERVILDPGVLDESGSTTIDWFVPSPDGRLVAVSLSQGGTESGTVYVYETLTGQRRGDEIPRAHGGTAGGSLAWAIDGQGFYYTHYPRGNERPPEDMDFYQQVYFHKLGEDTDKDDYVLGKDLPRIAEIVLSTSEDGRHVLAVTQKGDGGEYRLDLVSIDQGSGRGDAGSRMSWTAKVFGPLADFSDNIVAAKFGRDEYLYMLSRDRAPRGKIIRLRLPRPDIKDASSFRPESLRAAEVVVPETDATIEDFLPTATRLYVLDVLGGPSQLRVFSLDGKALEPVKLPPVSAVAGLVSLFGDDILYNCQTYVTPPAWFHYTAATGESRKTALARTSPADFSDCEVVRETATSKDGTKVPVNIIRQKGTRLNGENPCIVWGYGGFGVNESPTFSPRRLFFVEQGGVYALAVIRGGGEFGEEWHKGGNLTNKQNCFDDFHAACQHMIDQKYTQPAKLAVFGGSNGGLLMGATLTQHPDLCAAVVSTVGIYDMLRVELSANGAFNVTEYGTVKDPEQFKALYAYSPYHHVKDGTRYPAVLFMTGANDPRVDPMQSRKMTARLQAADSKGTVLLRTSANTGHIGSSLKERIEQTVDVYAFILAELGVKYQPK